MRKNSTAILKRQRKQRQQILLRHNIRKYGVEKAIQIPLQNALRKLLNKVPNNRTNTINWLYHTKQLIDKYTLDGYSLDVNITVDMIPPVVVHNIPVQIDLNDDGRNIQ